MAVNTQTAYPFVGGDGARRRISARIDFSKAPRLSSDVVDALVVDGPCWIDKVFCKVDTPEGTTCTAKLGITGATDAIDASVNFNATAGTWTLGMSSADTYLNGILPASTPAKRTLQFVLNNNASNAVMDIIADVVLLDTANYAI
jgi:hypothetical protein